MTRLLLIACLLAPLVAGCGGRRPAPVDAGDVVKVAVFDSRLLYDVAPDGEVLDEGWWFSSRDRFLSANIGIHLGEALAAEIERLRGVEVFSREDLDAYLGQKERLIQRNYPTLGPLERKDLLARMDPVDYGRSLNVDYVVMSEIPEASTVINRTFSWWLSTLEANVVVWDVDAGQSVASVSWRDFDHLDSQLALAEECAREVTRQLERNNSFRVAMR